MNVTPTTIGLRKLIVRHYNKGEMVRRVECERVLYEGCGGNIFVNDLGVHRSVSVDNGVYYVNMHTIPVMSFADALQKVVKHRRALQTSTLLLPTEVDDGWEKRAEHRLSTED